MKVEHEIALLRLAMESDFPLPAAKNVCRTLADYLVAKRKGDHYQAALCQQRVRERLQRLYVATLTVGSDAAEAQDLDEARCAVDHDFRPAYDADGGRFYWLTESGALQLGLSGDTTLERDGPRAVKIQKDLRAGALQAWKDGPAAPLPARLADFCNNLAKHYETPP